MAPRNNPRRFFQQMQPTFSIEMPIATTKLEFLDENDPEKNTIVRKKAREWVNKNKKSTSLECRSRQQTKCNKMTAKNADVGTDKRQILERKSISHPAEKFSPLQIVGGSSMDPFSILPNVGRRVDHIIEHYFITRPEEIPCSDDKFIDVKMEYAEPRDSLVPISRAETILGNMIGNELNFTLWLYATAAIRDGTLGCFSSEEVHCKRSSCL
jgi:hypothetical protein